MDLKNKTILITDGSAGIGLEAAKQFIGIGSLIETSVIHSVIDKVFPKGIFLTTLPS
jgi:short-subunit dehydrogenase involved in D-alanine esterification of teichoic acids